MPGVEEGRDNVQFELYEHLSMKVHAEISVIVLWREGQEEEIDNAEHL